MLVVVVLILGVVVNSGIEQRVADGLRCQISRIFGSSAGCATGHSGVGGGAINAGVTRGGVTRGGPTSGEAIRGDVTRGGVISAGATIRDGAGNLLAHTDSLPQPAGYSLYIARLATYCQSHPHQRFHPLAPGQPWVRVQPMIAPPAPCEVVLAR